MICKCGTDVFADVGYLDNNSYTVLQPTAWIPLLDANEFNGCMEVRGPWRLGLFIFINIHYVVVHISRLISLRLTNALMQVE